MLEGGEGLGQWKHLHAQLVARRNKLVAQLGTAFQVTWREGVEEDGRRPGWPGRAGISGMYMGAWQGGGGQVQKKCKGTMAVCAPRFDVYVWGCFPDRWWWVAG